MKIVIDATAAVSGGKLYLERLLPQFAQIDSTHEFIIFHTGDLDGLAATLGGGRFGFHRVSLRLPGTISRQLVAATMLKVLWREFVLPFRLRRIQPDLLFSNSGALPVWKPAKTKSVVALHNCMPLCEELIDEERSALRRWRLKLLRRQMRQALQACDGSVAFSEDTRARIRQNFGELPRLPFVVHHAIDWGERERQSKVTPEDLQRQGVEQPYLLYVSQFHRYKNVIRLLEAFARVTANHSNLQLVLAGSAADGGYWDEVRQSIERLHLTGSVVCVPPCPREQLIALYRGALAFVQPSLAETCSFPLLESLALGVPAAAARNSAMPEMAGDAAVYFDPYEVVEMAEVIERLVWDENLRGDLGRRAVEQAAKFTWEGTARQTLSVFGCVTGSENRASKLP